MLVGEPNCVSVTNFKRELFANAQSVHSLRGNGMLGFAVLVLGATKCNRVANLPNGGNANNWVAPAHPGDAPVVPANASAAIASRIIAQWEHEVEEFKQCLECENTLKQLALAGIDSDFVVSLSDPLCRSAQVTVRQIIEHLEARCSSLDQDMLTKNLEDLESPWKPAVSMEPLWQRDVVAQQVATAGHEPVTDAALVRIHRQILIDTGLFMLNLHDWDKKAENDKTWANFKTFFSDADKNRVKDAAANQLQHGAFSAVGRPGCAGSRPGSPAVVPGAPLTRSTGSSPLTTPGLLEFGCCWSHGLGTNADHNSVACTNKANGHQEDAAI